MSKLNDLDDYDDTIEEIDTSEEGRQLAVSGTFEVLSLEKLDIDVPEDKKELKGEVVMALRRLMVDRDISAKVRKDAAHELAEILEMFPTRGDIGGSGNANVQINFSRQQAEQIGTGMGVLRDAMDNYEILEVEDA